MNIELTTQEIDGLCLRMVDVISRLYPEYIPHMHFLYYYGVRISELFDARIFPAEEPYFITVFPKKRNDIRTLPIVSDSTAQYLEDLSNASTKFHLNKKNLERIIKKHNLFADIRIGQKNVGSHIFRHNWVKKQIQTGKQITTIQSDLGERELQSVNSYAYSKPFAVMGDAPTQ